jgi:hypothetical protein
VDPTPNNILVTPSQTQSIIVPINATGLSSLKFEWAPEQGQTATIAGCKTTGQFPSSFGTTCTFAVLRVDLMQTPGTITSANLASNVRTFYLQPVSGGGTGAANFSSASTSGTVVGASCSSSCSVTVSGLGGTGYYARLSTIYHDTQGVTITGNNGTVNFTGAQAIIDVTGKAQDVLKRVQVRYPMGITKGEAPYALQSDNTICKRFTVGAGVFDSQCD